MAAFSSSSIMLHKDDLRNKPEFQWPNNNGCDDSEQNHTLRTGDLIDRFGDDNGYYFGNAGDYFIYRSLPNFGEFDETDKEKMKNMKKEYENYYDDPKNFNLYNQYKVIKDFDVSMCKIAPAFGYPGGGHQYRTFYSINNLIKNGKIKKEYPYILPQFMHPDSTSSGGRTRRRRTKRRYCRRKTHYRRKLTTTG